LALLGAAVTGASRMYVGAHLPLDIVGGAAVGWLVGTAATCGAGCCGSRRSPNGVPRVE
jgi:membrane-associated phospholipid phosphatase